jgi:steroid 5-alpha reductase family enzyme
MYSDFWFIYLRGFLLLMALLTCVWMVSVKIIDASIVDPFWGLGFVVLAIYFYFNSHGNDTRKLVVLLLASVWGLRLFGYLFWRNMGKPEDYRYAQFRNRYGASRYWWVSFFQVFLLQGILLWIISAPLLVSQFEGGNIPLGRFDILGVFFWLIGFLFEAGGDYQLAKFKSDQGNRGKVLNTGFWKYTRHPNYFGDACVWCGFACFSISVNSYWPMLSSVLMIVLLLKVSGVSLLERALKKNKPEYEEYTRRTSSFFPWFPRK